MESSILPLILEAHKATMRDSEEGSFIEVEAKISTLLTNYALNKADLDRMKEVYEGAGFSYTTRKYTKRFYESKTKSETVHVISEGRKITRAYTKSNNYLNIGAGHAELPYKLTVAIENSMNIKDASRFSKLIRSVDRTEIEFDLDQDNVQLSLFLRYDTSNDGGKRRTNYYVEIEISSELDESSAKIFIIGLSAALEIVNRTTLLYTPNEALSVIQSYNNNIQSFLRKGTIKHDAKTIYSYYLYNPITLLPHHLSFETFFATPVTGKGSQFQGSNQWYVTHKADGERVQLYVSKIGIFIIRRGGRIMDLAVRFDRYDRDLGLANYIGYIIDAEYLPSPDDWFDPTTAKKYNFAAFDCIYSPNENFQHRTVSRPFSMRVAEMQLAARMMSRIENLNVSPKQFTSLGSTPNDFFLAIRAVVAAQTNSAFKDITWPGLPDDTIDGAAKFLLKNIPSYSTDGIMFVPEIMRYVRNQHSNANILKWKPASHLSVDLLFASGKLQYSTREGNEEYSKSRYAINYNIDAIVQEGNVKSGDVIELIASAGELKYFRHRPDKPKPNAKQVVEDFNKATRKNLDYGDIAGFTSTLFRMHQTRKRGELAKGLAKHANVLIDIGSGAGSLVNYYTTYTHIVAIDPYTDEDNFNEFQKRLDGAKLRYKLIEEVDNSSLPAVTIIRGKFGSEIVAQFINERFPNQNLSIFAFNVLHFFDSNDMRSLQSIMEFGEPRRQIAVVGIDTDRQSTLTYLVDRKATIGREGFTFVLSEEDNPDTIIVGEDTRSLVLNIKGMVTVRVGQEEPLIDLPERLKEISSWMGGVVSYTPMASDSVLLSTPYRKFNAMYMYFTLVNSKIKTKTLNKIEGNGATKIMTLEDDKVILVERRTFTIYEIGCIGDNIIHAVLKVVCPGYIDGTLDRHFTARTWSKIVAERSGIDERVIVSKATYSDTLAQTLAILCNCIIIFVYFNEEEDMLYEIARPGDPDEQKVMILITDGTRFHVGATIYGGTAAQVIFDKKRVERDWGIRFK